jgi:polyhydroxyalkanoate synthesis regulator protein
MTPEAWSQFMSLPPPGMQGMMGTYVEQSKSMIAQMQEQMQKQAEQVLGAFTPKR